MSIKEGLDSVINIGVSPSSRPFDAIQKRTFNIILLMSFLFIALSLSTNIVDRSWLVFDTILYSSAFATLITSFILLRNGFFKTSVILFLTFYSATMFLLALITNHVYLSSLCTLVLVMIAIIVLKSQKLQIAIAVLLFLQQVVIFFILGSDYSFGGVDHSSANNKFKPVERSIVYFCFYWFLFSMTFSLKRQITKSASLLKLKNQEIQDSYTEMEKFGHVISHDLKSPIRNMTNFAGLISKKIENNQLERVGEFSEIIQNNGAKAIHLIDDVLQFSKLKQETQQELKSSVDLDLLMHEIENDILMLYPQSVLKSENLGQLFGNYSKVKTLFQNLIENGLKYNNSPDPMISIKRQTIVNMDIISIQDNGIGINEKHYSIIFEPFKRLHDDSSYAGNGIGLASCKSIVEEHLGGHLSISSQIDKGSIFTINIPVK